jgi:hypothetical protein
LASKRKLIIDSMILTILLVFALQITIFGISVSSKKNVTGIVYASSGVPVSGASVSASGPEGSGFTMTNVNGQYTINEGLKTGSYTITVFREGYLVTEIQDVIVTAPSETSGVNVYLNKSGGISGTVTDNISSMGIPNIGVYAMPSSGSGTYYGAGMTDIAGNYQINMNLGTETYNVTVLLPKGYVSKTVSPVSVTAGSTTTGVNLALQRSGIISGRITAPNGQPLANQTVIATASGGGVYYFGSDETNATGYYRIASGLGTGAYTVMAGTYPDMNITTTPVSVIAGAETPNVDLQLEVTPPEPSGILMGKVTDFSDGTPIEDAYVLAEGDITFSFGSAYTDKDGNYVISEGLDTDTYTVTASADGYQDANVTMISVTVNLITQNVNLQLHRIPAAQSGKISGTVTGDTNPIPEFEYPIAIMMVITLVAVALAKTSEHKTKYP